MKVVDAYGVKLDELATPQQVVYVLLRSIRDDVDAAQKGDREGQKRAFRTTFSLGAFSEIEKRMALSLSENKQETLGDLRDRRLYDVIYHWAPIVAHYVASFDLDEKTAIGRMREQMGTTGVPTCTVLYDVAHDPTASDPAKRQPATVEVVLTRERATSGSQEFWRVARVAFRGTQAARSASRPAAQDAPSPLMIAPPAESRPAGR